MERQLQLRLYHHVSLNDHMPLATLWQVWIQ